MFKFIVFSIALAVCQGQGYNGDPKQAGIISEQRYLSGDGKFGAAYTQEDGINFKEETDSDGTRHGSYSYLDPSGQRRTISYTAGKNGFQASGDHLPQAPPAPPQPIPQAVQQPHYSQPAPRYNSAPAPVVPYTGGSADYSEGQYDPRHNDPNFEGNRLSGNQQQQYHAPPQQPQYHHSAPVVPQHHQPASFNHNFQHQQQPNFAPQPQQHYTTTPHPPQHRFNVPGKLSLNRTPDGFSYSFNKV